MFKSTLALLLFTISTLAYSSSASYYRQISKDASGNSLKNSLHKLLQETHIKRGYGELIRAYTKADRDTSYDKDNSIVDIYSENPASKDPYKWSTKRQKCGSYKREGDCFNREHLFPQGTFFKSGPMRTDFFHVYATDGYVNNIRNNYPFGEVDTLEWSSKNNSKLGYSRTSGEYTGLVFEPIDEFKGDIARALLYFATRYGQRSNNWKSHAMLSISRDKFYTEWFLQLLLKWHKMDPVSKHEIQRNNFGQTFQGNRNPFIDHPEWAERIWN